MDIRRLRAGEWVAAAGGVALPATLFTAWYGTSTRVGPLEVRVNVTGWHALAVVDVLLAVVAATGLALALLTATQRVPTLPVAACVATVVLGAAGVLLVVWRIVDQPGPNDLVEVRPGAYLGLAAAVAVLGGGWLALRTEAPGVPSQPAPIDLRPTPPREPPASA